MKKIINILFLFFSFSFYATSQQVGQYSQYIWNSYLINPAIGGAENFIEWKAGYRNQWVGLEGAPKTMYLTMHGQKGKKLMNREDNDLVNRSLHTRPPSKFAKALGFTKRKFPTAPSSFNVKPHHGFGGQIMADNIGPFSTIGVYGSYAYHIPVAREVYISMGVFLGVKQYKIDINKITLTDQNDKAIGAGMQGLAPDGMIGAMAYGNRFYIGASMNQMLYNHFKFKGKSGEVFSTAQLTGHYFLMGGYRFKLSQEFAFVPSSIIRLLPGTPVSMDITAKLNYLDILWAGASLRGKDAFVVLAGISYKNKYHFGYSYDITTSSIRKVSYGSHEVIIGYRLVNKTPSRCRPSYVW